MQPARVSRVTSKSLLLVDGRSMPSIFNVFILSRLKNSNSNSYTRLRGEDEAISCESYGSSSVVLSLKPLIAGIEHMSMTSLLQYLQMAKAIESEYNAPSSRRQTSTIRY